MIWITTVLGCLTFVFGGYAFAVSQWEGERRAAWKYAVGAVFLSGLFLTPELLGDPFNQYLSAALIILTLGGCLFLLLPTRKVSHRPDTLLERVDERTVMFSRAELEPGTERFESYYSEYPNHRIADDGFRQLPGLLQPETKYYHPWLFQAANATFDTVERLHQLTEGPINPTKEPVEAVQIGKFIHGWCHTMGAHSLGVTRLKPEHLYSKGGRRHNYGQEVVNDHPFALVMTVEMESHHVKMAPRGPITLESSARYLQAGEMAVQVAGFIRRLGYSARAHIDGNYQVRCPQIARDAGLGEIGRMSLLMTPNLGPRVRISVVTTDLPLIPSHEKFNSSVLDFCRICKKCAEVCPAQAISLSDEPESGKGDWAINQEKCFTYWCKAGTDCGRCIAVCPYSHPDNLLHQLARTGIRTSGRFQRFALIMDQWIYGRKPPVRSISEWMQE